VEDGAKAKALAAIPPESEE